MKLAQRLISPALFLLGFLASFGTAQEKLGPLTLEQIENVLADLLPARAATIIRDRGVDFEVTEEVKERLRRVGADVLVIQAVEKATAEYAKRRVEEEKKIEEEKRKKAFEEVRRKAAEKKRRDETGEMVLIPAGEFWMGSEDGESDEKPRRRVYLDAFHIDKYEITNALYRQFMLATGKAAPAYWNDDNFNSLTQPVVGVTWHDAGAYCQWAGKRLPTEAEWEKAARGTDGRKYPWGNQWDLSRVRSKENKQDKPLPVGSRLTSASPYGVHDMAGNVWEWVADWHDENYYKRAANNNPKGPDSGQHRVLRGGAWDSSSRQLRSSIRDRFDPGSRGNTFGFRCAQ